jgi:Acetyltransferase (GNAT) domain
MQKEIDTPRLKLILVDKDTLADGSKYLDSAHAVLGSPGATQWKYVIPYATCSITHAQRVGSLLTSASLRGVSRSLEETQKRVSTLIRSTDPEDTSNRYRAGYIVHVKDVQSEGELLKPIGIVDIHGCITYGTPFGSDIALPAEVAERESILSQELGYMFIPEAWGKGYCTEAVQALLKAYKENTSFWKPYRGVFLYIIIGMTNDRSAKVPGKIRIKKRGVHRWDGEHVFLGGAMQAPEVMVFGDYLIRPN